VSAVELTTGAARARRPCLPRGLDGRDSPDRTLPGGCGQPLGFHMFRPYASLLSLPLLGSLPCGWTKDGLQLAGRRGVDGLVLRVAATGDRSIVTGRGRGDQAEASLPTHRALSLQQGSSSQR
jgi:hypothetical protein